jgi:hypothetical protein
MRQPMSNLAPMRRISMDEMPNSNCRVPIGETALRYFHSTFGNRHSAFSSSPRKISVFFAPPLEIL